jgi:hypothetical protein
MRVMQIHPVLFGRRLEVGEEKQGQLGQRVLLGLRVLLGQQEVEEVLPSKLSLSPNPVEHREVHRRPQGLTLHVF